MHSVVRELLPRTLRPHRILNGPLRGTRIVTSWHDYPNAILGRVEPLLIDWLASNVGPGETWLDVGAHHGYMSLMLAMLVGSGGRVFAFEPVPETAAALERTRSINSISHLTILPVALDNIAELHELRMPVVRGMAFTGAGAGQSMFAVALDAAWPMLSRGDTTVHGIKMDVQGMELVALRGMMSVLRARPKLVVEVHAGIDRNELIALLRNAGYTSHEPIEPQSTPAILDNRSYLFH